MLRSRSGWVRVLQLYALDEDAADPMGRHIEDLLLDARVHARSRFRSLADPRRFAHYAVHNSEDAPLLELSLIHI